MRTWSGIITALLNNHDLTVDDTFWAMDRVMRGEATSAQVSGFLIALRAKGETTAEITGLADALRPACDAGGRPWGVRGHRRHRW